MSMYEKVLILILCSGMVIFLLIYLIGAIGFTIDKIEGRKSHKKIRKKVRKEKSKMKLIKAANGDYINAEHIDDLGICDLGKKAIVAHIGENSYPLVNETQVGDLEQALDYITDELLDVDFGYIDIPREIIGK